MLLILKKRKIYLLPMLLKLFFKEWLDEYSINNGAISKQLKSQTLLLFMYIR